MICQMISYFLLSAALVMAEVILQEDVSEENISSCYERDLLIKQSEDLKAKSDEFWKKASDELDRIGYPSRKPEQWKDTLDKFKTENKIINDQRRQLKIKFRELSSECNKIKEGMTKYLKNRAQRESGDNGRVNLLEELDKIWYGFSSVRDDFRKKMSQSDEARDAVKRREAEIMGRMRVKI